MTPKRVRISVRCETCRAATILSPEQYRTLVKESRVALLCPHCARSFVYSPMGTAAADFVRQPPAEGNSPGESVPASPPSPSPVSAPEFPPPPFASLGVGPTTPAKRLAPVFEQLDGGPAVPSPAGPPPQGAETTAGNETKPVSLNDRWKRLPPWVQWLVIGVVIVFLAIVIFAMPVGGSGDGKPEAAKPAATDSRPAQEERQP